MFDAFVKTPVHQVGFEEKFFPDTRWVDFLYLENQCIFKESERWYTERELEDACLESFNEGYQEASD